MKRIYYLCLQLSIIGLAASILAQIASFIGDGISLKVIDGVLVLGIVPLALVANAAHWAVRRYLGIGIFRFYWTSTLWVGCPKKMRTAAHLFMLYYVLCFGAFALLDLWASAVPKSDYWNGRIFCWLMSAFAIAVYGQMIPTFYAVLYTDDHSRECPNGHPVFPWSKKCNECGASIAEDPSRQ
jgi:hypothetical protein